MSFATLSASDPTWLDVLSRTPHDVYHLPAWARVCATHEPWEVRLAVAERGEDVLVMPYMLRGLPKELPGGAGLYDVTVPYGYPGPVCSSTEASTQRDLFGELLEGFSEMRAITVFVRFHSYVGVPHSALESLGDVVAHGHQVWIDLDALPESPVSTFRADHRRNIRILREMGFALAVDRDEDWDAFPSEYYATMARLSSDPYYLFPQEYFDTVRAEFGPDAHLVACIAPSGEPAAMALALTCGDMAQYHLSGTNDVYRKLAASKLAILGMAEICRDADAKILNLGGGLGGHDDDLFKFKAGFSKCRKVFATGRFVLDYGLYDSLSARTHAPGGFFPAYRHRL